MGHIQRRKLQFIGGWITWGLLFVTAANPSIALAQDAPQWLPARLVERMRSFGHQEAIERASQIRTLSGEDFARAFEAAHAQFIGGGYNGLAFSGAGGTFKISHLALFHPELRKPWERLRLFPTVAQLPNRVWDEKVGMLTIGERLIAIGEIKAALDTHAPADLQMIRNAFGRLENARPSVRELIGSVIWSIYDPNHLPLPELASSDGLAYHRPFVDGDSLADVLKSEREGGTLHQKYSMPRVWAQLVEIQDAAEQMLLNYGVMIDLVVPGNLIVSGAGEGTRVVTVDPEVIEPTQEVFKYYRSIGFKVPVFDYLPGSKGVRWPLMPNHIVSSVHWALTFEQAIQYMRAYYHLSTDAEAIQKLAGTPRWNISAFPGMNRYANLRRAWKSCAAALISQK